MKHPYKNIYDSLFNELFSNDFFSLTSYEPVGRYVKIENWFNAIEDNTNFPKEDDKNFHKTQEVKETDTHIVTKEVWKSIDGTQRFERTTSQSKTKPQDQLKPTKEDLQLQLEGAIKSQDFEKACDLRDQIKNFK